MTEMHKEDMLRTGEDWSQLNYRELQAVVRREEMRESIYLIALGIGLFWPLLLATWDFAFVVGVLKIFLPLILVGMFHHWRHKRWMQTRP